MIGYAHCDGICGFTPHLYSIKFPYVLSEGGLIVVERICLIDSCGIQIGSMKENKRYDIEILKTSTENLSQQSVEALIRSWRGYTGYTLL